MYKRKIEKVLLDWKHSESRKPLVIKGCRQCGKTSSVLEFAKRNYMNVVYIDFHEHEELIQIFSGALNVDFLTVAISAAMPDARFVPHKTCIVFDEIQDCPRARASLKFFKLDGRYDVICTGSLLGVSGYKNDSELSGSIPVGFETIVDMYPMDFEEWLWANGIQQPVFDMLNNSYESETPVPLPIHNRMRQLLLEYVIVGGMPEAVKTFLTKRDVNQMIEVQKSILEEYKSDMVKYANPGDRPRIRECFESIPRQLSRDNKKFSYTLVRKGARSSQYIGSLQWIEDAGIIRRCYNLQITELPLSGNSLPDSFKVYMADTGLFICMLGEGTQFDILQGNLLSFKGAIFENVMADMLGKKGMKLYYYQKNDGIEIDFVTRYKGKCTPIECKAKNGNAKSLKTLLSHPEKYHVDQALKFGDYNVGRDGMVLTLPFYMGFVIPAI